ncbi:MAG: N-acetylmuramoyl-L-alanine amidase [Cytophagales bacterium]|nr:N-acetylmuramoyl-L-alanine amidase [Cytophagales bacterium]
MRNIAIPVIFSLILVLASFTPAGKTRNTISKIVIDPGHGGKDPGTSGSMSKEKDLALSIAKHLGRIMQDELPEVEILYTRDDDSFPTLQQRSDFANREGADLFISVHCNWISNPKIYGSETYVMGLHKTEENFQIAKRENAVILQEENYEENYDGFDPNSPESYIFLTLQQSAFQESSLKLATGIEKQLGTRAGRRSRGVKSAGFIVLYKTTMPSVLVETGYLSNSKEEADLNDDLKQRYIASGIFRAIRDYKKEVESTN